MTVAVKNPASRGYVALHMIMTKRTKHVHDKMPGRASYAKGHLLAIPKLQRYLQATRLRLRLRPLGEIRSRPDQKPKALT